MEHQYIWWLAVTSTLYLSFTADLVEGGCKGRWAIHACLGGNGKRSSPNSALLANSILYKRLLERLPLSEEIDPPQQPDQLDYLPESRAREDLYSSIERINNILDTLAQQNRKDALDKELGPLATDVSVRDW